MIVAALLIATFVATVMTGPAGVEWRERRRARTRALPAATVHYLPSACCRDNFERVEAVDWTRI